MVRIFIHKKKSQHFRLFKHTNRNRGCPPVTASSLRSGSKATLDGGVSSRASSLSIPWLPAPGLTDTPKSSYNCAETKQSHFRGGWALLHCHGKRPDSEEKTESVLLCHQLGDAGHSWAWLASPVSQTQGREKDRTLPTWQYWAAECGSLVT